MPLPGCITRANMPLNSPWTKADILVENRLFNSQPNWVFEANINKIFNLKVKEIEIKENFFFSVYIYNNGFYYGISCISILLKFAHISPFSACFSPLPSVPLSILRLLSLPIYILYNTWDKICDTLSSSTLLSFALSPFSFLKVSKFHTKSTHSLYIDFTCERNVLFVLNSLYSIHLLVDTKAGFNS